MVVVPPDMDPVKKQRIAWGQNIDQALEARKWTRKQLAYEIAQAFEKRYGDLARVSEQAIAQWISGRTAPGPFMQAAIADVTGIPASLLFPPIQLQRSE